jgi:hypothetical protein
MIDVSAGSDQREEEKLFTMSSSVLGTRREDGTVVR